MAANLMDLPPEIRNQIYFYCESLVPTSFAPLISETTSIFIAGCEIRHGCLYIDCCCKPCLMKIAQPAITRVSRAIRSETLSIFYGANKIYLNTSNGVFKWVQGIKAHARLITVELGRSFNLNGGDFDDMLGTDLIILFESGEKVDNQAWYSGNMMSDSSSDASSSNSESQ